MNDFLAPAAVPGFCVGMWLAKKNPFSLPEFWAESAFSPCTLKPADQPPRTPETGRTTSLSGFEGSFTIFLLCLF